MSCPVQADILIALGSVGSESLTSQAQKYPRLSLTGLTSITSLFPCQPLWPGSTQTSGCQGLGHFISGSRDKKMLVATDACRT